MGVVDEMINKNAFNRLVTGKYRNNDIKVELEQNKYATLFKWKITIITDSHHRNGRRCESFNFLRITEAIKHFETIKKKYKLKEASP